MMLELFGKARVGRYSKRYALYLDNELSKALAGYNGIVQVYFNNMILRLKPSRTGSGRIILFLPSKLDETWALYYGRQVTIVIRLG